MATFFELAQTKLRNLRRDPRVVLSFQANEHTGEGLHPYVVIQGRARMTEGGALEVMDQLAESYLGPGQKYPMRDVPEGPGRRRYGGAHLRPGAWGKETDTA